MFDVRVLTRHPLPGETDRGRRVAAEDVPTPTNGTIGTARHGSNSREASIQNPKAVATAQQAVSARASGRVGTHEAHVRQDVRTAPTLAPTTQAKPRSRTVPAQGQLMPRTGAPAWGSNHMYNANPLAQSLPGSRPARPEETDVFSPPAPITDLAYSRQHSQHRHPRDSMSTHRTVSEQTCSNAAPVTQLAHQQYERDPMAVKHEVIQQTFSFEEPLPKRPAWSNQGLPGRANTWEGSSLDHAPISSSDEFGTAPTAWMNADEWTSGGVGQSDFDSQYQQMAEQNFTTLLQNPNGAVSSFVSIFYFLAFFIVLE